MKKEGSIADPFELLGDNQKEWQRLERLLTRSQKHFVIWVSSNSPLFLENIYRLFLTTYANRYTHKEEDLSKWRGGSLFRRLRAVQEASPVPNRIFHLRHLPAEEDAIADINLERERFFSDLGASVIFWCTEATERAFQQYAFDFWDWLHHRFYFAVKEPLASSDAAWERHLLRRRLERLLEVFSALENRIRRSPLDEQALLDTARSIAEIYEQQGNAWEAQRFRRLTQQMLEKHLSHKPPSR